MSENAPSGSSRKRHISQCRESRTTSATACPRPCTNNLVPRRSSCFGDGLHIITPPPPHPDAAHIGPQSHPSASAEPSRSQSDDRAQPPPQAATPSRRPNVNEAVEIVSSCAHNRCRTLTAQRTTTPSFQQAPRNLKRICDYVSDAEFPGGGAGTPVFCQAIELIFPDVCGTFRLALRCRPSPRSASRERARLSEFVHAH